MATPTLQQVLNDTMGEVAKQLTLIGKALAKTRQLLGGGNAPVLDEDFEVKSPVKRGRKAKHMLLTPQEAQRRRAAGLRKYHREQKRLRAQNAAPQQIGEIL